MVPGLEARRSTTPGSLSLGIEVKAKQVKRNGVKAVLSDDNLTSTLIASAAQCQGYLCGSSEVFPAPALIWKSLPRHEENYEPLWQQED